MPNVATASEFFNRIGPDPTLGGAGSSLKPAEADVVATEAANAALR